MTHVSKGQRNVDSAVGMKADRKARQVLIDFLNDQMTSLSQMIIIEKIENAIKEVNFPLSPENFTIEDVTKLHNNGIVILFNFKEMADWLQDPENEMLVISTLDLGASIRPRQHVILVSKIPLTLDPNNDVHIREIEEGNQLKEKSISKI